MAVALTNATSFNISSINRLLNGQNEHSIQTLEGLNFFQSYLGPLSLRSPHLSQAEVLIAYHFKVLAPIEFRLGVFQAVQFGGTEPLTINVDVITGVF